MKRTISFLCVVAMSAAVTVAQRPLGTWPAAHPDGSQGANVVRVQQNRGQDVVRLALDQPASVHTLEIIGGDALPFSAVPWDDADRELEELVTKSPVIARVRVTKKAPVLNEDRSWIDSTVHATVLEMIKRSDDAPMRPDSGVTFPESGGEMSVGGKKIVARLPWARPTKANQEYLLFWWKTSAGEWRTRGPQDTYERQGARWVRLLSDDSGGIEQLDAEDVLRRIRAKARRVVPKA